MTAEEWRPVPGFPSYFASSDGRIKTQLRYAPRVMAAFVGNNGYLRVQIMSPEGKRVARNVHRLVALAFHGEPAAGLEVRHLDGDPLNNHAENLKWGTKSENVADTLRHGRHNLASRTHCPQGHPYDEANTYRSPARPTARNCRTCLAARNGHKRAALTPA